MLMHIGILLYILLCDYTINYSFSCWFLFVQTIHQWIFSVFLHVHLPEVFCEKYQKVILQCRRVYFLADCCVGLRRGHTSFHCHQQALGAPHGLYPLKDITTLKIVRILNIFQSNGSKMAAHFNL